MTDSKQNILKQVREKSGLSQEKLASILNVSQKTVSSWEIGRTSPRPWQMEHIGDIFSKPKEEIFFGSFNYKNELKM